MKDTLSHRQLQSLIYVSNILNSSLDLDSIIHSMMKETIAVIDAADAGVLFLYNTEQQCLIAKSTFGYETSRLMQIKLKPGQAMAGKTFLAKKCLIFTNQDEVRETYNSLSEQILELFDESVPNYPYSAVCTPIISNGECLGVINLGSFQPHSQFTTDDVNLMTAISHQAAVALKKAKLYHEKEQAVQELEILNTKITQQNEIFSRSIELHNTLATLVLSGEGLSSILNYIPKKIGYHCLLFDDLGELISSSSSYDITTDILEKLKEKATAFADASETNKSILSIQVQGESHTVVLLPIGSKPRLLGVLLVLSEKAIEKVDIAALEHACTIISLELMKKQAILETEQRLNGEFIDVLFSGKMDESLMQKAKHLQLHSKSNYVAVLINMKHITTKRHKRYLLEFTNKFFSKNNSKVIIAEKNDQIVVLLSFNPSTSLSYNNSQVKESIHLFQQELNIRGWEKRVSIGVGRLKEGLKNAYTSAQEAAKCLQFIQAHSLSKKTMSYSELGVQRLLLQNTEEELLDFIYEMLGPLIEYDRTREGHLLHTLFSYLEHNRKGTETAKTLHMHVNTLNYRLKRIEEILSINLSDTEKFLNVQLAVTMYHYMKEKIEQ
ncbi:helix-turn-helix domain-containing protein [Bacillus sp. S13(2024)]|uniref:helix-turn-helix domain-containing protein n=1 Tax=unclassified Bacillus (in: firmicutes) TaxID=185979 RepID=UPI003D1DBD11